MSKNKQFSSTSAERYSLALYELSCEANSLKVIEQHTSSILNLINLNNDFNNLIKDPTGNQDNLISVINKISENFKIDDLLKNFLIFLVKKRRFFYLEKILKSFIEICSMKRGEIKAEIKSAKELKSEEVEKISTHIKYPPVGKRTFGINRAQEYGLNFNNYVQSWNDESIIIIQIESKKGLENIELITKHKSIDGVMIGPYDLSGSLGYPGEINHPTVSQACSKIIDTCKKRNISCGTQISIASEKNINESIKNGYNFIILGSDLFILSEWSRRTSETIHKFKL